LTDFEEKGYILIVNHLKKEDIAESYKAIITGPDTICCPCKTMFQEMFGRGIVI